MNTHDIRARYLAFCKKNGHALMPSASLRPENDPTTLFTSSGMQPLVPYLMGQKHSLGTRLANSQRCFRAEDIDDVGDNRHTTFFEMLGNWSLGDYFKKEQLPWIFHFLVDEVGLDPSRLYVTCFSGDDTMDIPRDEESAAIWKGLFATKGIDAPIVDIGTEEDGARNGMRNGRIFYYTAAKNWWSRAGVPEDMPTGEIGGPDSEIFYDFGTPHDSKYGQQCHPNCDCGRFMEIGNSVFIEYIKNDDGTFARLSQRNVDFGGGLERIAAASIDTPDIFALDIFAPMIAALEKESGKKYTDASYVEAFRVIADHVRGSVFMIADGIMPSNKEQGYILRKLLRRAVLYSDRLGITRGRLGMLAEYSVRAYEDVFDDVRKKREDIVSVISEEEKKFRRALTKGLKEFEKIVQRTEKEISGHDAFILFTTYGFPYELTEELAKERGLTIHRKDFEKEFKEHQKLSQSASEQKFKGGLADHSAITTAFHTATHLMLAGLRKELGSHVHQAGSNITAERTRFDFTHQEKVPRDVLDRVERYVNDVIAADAKVIVEEIDKDVARADESIEGSFWHKYPERVTVYTVRSDDGTVWSRELCGGPHVTHTGEIARYGRFAITKEKSSSAGVRRVKAVFVPVQE